METRIYRIVAQTDPVTVQSKKQEGGELSKCVIRLKSLGGKYEDEFLCTVFGPQALEKFAKDDVVAAQLQFRTHEANGNYYQDTIANDIVRINEPVKAF